MVIRCRLSLRQSLRIKILDGRAVFKGDKKAAPDLELPLSFNDSSLLFYKLAGLVVSSDLQEVEARCETGKIGCCFAVDQLSG